MKRFQSSPIGITFGFAGEFCTWGLVAVLAILAQGNPEAFALADWLRVVQWAATFLAMIWGVLLAASLLVLLILAVGALCMWDHRLLTRPVDESL